MAGPKRSRALLVLLGCVAALALCAAAALALPSLGVELALADIYRDTGL